MCPAQVDIDWTKTSVRCISEHNEECEKKRLTEGKIRHMASGFEQGISPTKKKIIKEHIKKTMAANPYSRTCDLKQQVQGYTASLYNNNNSSSSSSSSKGWNDHVATVPGTFAPESWVRGVIKEVRGELQQLESSDETGVQALVKTLEEWGLDYKVTHEEGGRVTSISYVDNQLSPPPESYAQLMADVTHHIINPKDGFSKLSSITSITPNREVQPLVISAVVSENTFTFVSELQLLGEIFPHLKQQHAVMLVDGDTARIAAVKKEFPIMQIMLCGMHTEENALRRLGKCAKATLAADFVDSYYVQCTRCKKMRRAEPGSIDPAQEESYEFIRMFECSTWIEAGCTAPEEYACSGGCSGGVAGSNSSNSSNSSSSNSSSSKVTSLAAKWIPVMKVADSGQLIGLDGELEKLPATSSLPTPLLLGNKKTVWILLFP